MKTESNPVSVTELCHRQLNYFGLHTAWLWYPFLMAQLDPKIPQVLLWKCIFSELALNLKILSITHRARFTSACYRELKTSIYSGVRKVGEISDRETVVSSFMLQSQLMLRAVMKKMTQLELGNRNCCVCLSNSKPSLQAHKISMSLACYVSSFIQSLLTLGDTHYLSLIMISAVSFKSRLSKMCFLLPRFNFSAILSPLLLTNLFCTQSGQKCQRLD